jgi:MOSC domain-containing protein YiiM
MLEEHVHIGDQFAIGEPRQSKALGSAGIPAGSVSDKTSSPASPHAGRSYAKGTAQIIVTQPRLPCYKLGIRFEADDMVKKFLASRRIGFYVAVTQEGQVAAGDEITVISRDPRGVSMSDFLRLYLAKQWNPADISQIHTLFELPSLPNDWKSYFDHRLQEMTA